ncbi:hypothetical protein CPZ87_17390 [Piscinibacter gummiphilus]|nr:hypothetical protein CPZ87_17390 [Piscinibacter gummiphilus]
MGAKLLGTTKAMPLSVMVRCRACLPRACTVSMAAVAARLSIVHFVLVAVPAADDSKSSQNSSEPPHAGAGLGVGDGDGVGDGVGAGDGVAGAGDGVAGAGDGVAGAGDGVPLSTGAGAGVGVAGDGEGVAGEGDVGVAATGAGTGPLTVSPPPPHATRKTAVLSRAQAERSRWRSSGRKVDMAGRGTGRSGQRAASRVRTNSWLGW